MKSKLYYWIAMGVLVLTTIFFAVLCQIQSSYAQEALREASREQALAAQHAEMANRQAQIAQTRAVEAERARKDALAAIAELQECKGSK
ncbi:MAG: hypothetical protein AAGA85_18570 [Bacteroidota bacterium]